MARLIRTEKEVEGRYEEVWLVVEEDALEQWPAGPLEVVGRPATRGDGLARARGEAVYTADLKLNGMLHAAVLRSPHAHARVTRIDLAPALAAARRARGDRAGRHRPAGRRVQLPGRRRSPPSAPTRSRRREAALAAIEIEYEVLEPLLDPDEAVARGSVIGEPRARSAATSTGASTRRTSSSTGEFRT